MKSITTDSGLHIHTKSRLAKPSEERGLSQRTVDETMTAEPGVVADRSRLQKGYRSMGRSEGKFEGARKRAGS